MICSSIMVQRLIYSNRTLSLWKRKKKKANSVFVYMLMVKIICLMVNTVRFETPLNLNCLEGTLPRPPPLLPEILHWVASLHSPQLRTCLATACNCNDTISWNQYFVTFVPGQCSFIRNYGSKLNAHQTNCWKKSCTRPIGYCK